MAGHFFCNACGRECEHGGPSLFGTLIGRPWRKNEPCGHRSSASLVITSAEPRHTWADIGGVRRQVARVPLREVWDDSSPAGRNERP